MMIRMAKAAGLEIIYVPQARRTLGSARPPKLIRGQGTATAVTTARDVAWAGRQGRMIARREEHLGDISNSAPSTA